MRRRYGRGDLKHDVRCVCAAKESLGLSNKDCLFFEQRLKKEIETVPVDLQHWNFLCYL